MPEFVEPDRVSYEMADGAAVLRLDVDPPADEILEAGGWSALVRLTLVVADGPGEIGYLVKRVGPDLADPAPDGWDDAVERDGVLTVVFGAADDAPRLSVPLV